MNQIGREEARCNGLKRFYTGIACSKDHICERLVSSGECVLCKRVREARKYETDPSSHRSYYLRNRERLLEQQCAYDDARRDDKVEYHRAWRVVNNKYTEMYRKQNAGLYAFHSAKRRAKVRVATPPWSELEQIKQLYIEAARLSEETGIQHHVDHIIPLINKKVCGLHCLTNLCIITRDENLQKRNSFDSDAFSDFQ